MSPVMTGQVVAGEQEDVPGEAVSLLIHAPVSNVVEGKTVPAP